MPRLLLLFIFCLTAFTPRAQTKDDIAGNWKTVQVLLPAALKKNNPAATQRIEKAMIHTKFQFKSDGTCTVDSQEMPFKNCRWTFNEKEKSISITGDVDGEKGMLMKITVSQKNNKWYFEVFETPVILEVQRSAAAK